jgi:hypothetical protein
MKRKTTQEEREEGTLRLPARRLDSRGEVGSGCVFMLLLLVAIGYVGYLFAVPWFQYNNFEARISEMMPYYRHHDADYIQEAVIGTAAKDFDLKLKEEQVKVQVLQQENRIIIDIKYSKVVQLPFYAHTLNFNPHLTGQVY